MNCCTIKIVGSYLSPYVRKVLVCLEEKGVAYEVDPIVPFYGNDQFKQISPLRRIPVLIDDNGAISDSSVICEYLEECYPTPALLPGDPAARAKVRWLEEYADSHMGDVFIWRMYNEVIIKKYVWLQEPNLEVLSHAKNKEAPEILDYLESVVPAAGFIFGQLTIADIALACFFRNALFAGFQIDAKRWPKVQQLVSTLLQRPSFTKLQRWEDLSLKTPIAAHHQALKSAGAPISNDSYGGPTPIRAN
ncbi:glutathione S-transferase family protein [Halioxenophilus sp. WMMB6]|uniref:glutathione S-transferase family protein n=1 Tax=Halioxenophilus sp. WMMB6 TaxID=3073815 RepID=UPI00295E7896|nr:glutathione S-transferase family protein [Halioxenophilus sp. WMMB6]